MRGPAAACLLLLLSACGSSPETAPSSTPEAPAATAPVEAPPAADETYSVKREVAVPVDRAALEGSDAAELWVTRDGGTTWAPTFRFESNADQVTYAAPRDGRYGFRVVPLGPDGKPRFPPAPGRAPQWTVVVDTAIPEAVAIGPAQSARGEVALRYEIRHLGFAPLREVIVHTRPHGELEWTAAGRDDDLRSPVTLSAADGKYDVVLTCVSEAGAAGGSVQPAPGPDTPPQLILTVDTTAPVLKLVAPGSPVVRAGSVVKIGWTFEEANPEPKGLRLLHSRDDGVTWDLLVDGVDPARGSFPWLVHVASGATHRLALEAWDRAGNLARVESDRPFTIDSDLPDIAVLDHPKGDRRSPDVAVRFRAADATSDVRRVALYARPLKEGAPYVMLAEIGNAEGELEATLPAEGRWGIRLVATDAVGHLSTDPGPAVPPDFVVGYDKTPPAVTLKRFDYPGGAFSYISPHGELLWKATDNVSGEGDVTLRLEYSSDAGATWFVVSEKHPNTGAARLADHLKPGQSWRIRLTAVDPAGNEGTVLSGEFDPGHAPTPELALHGIEDGRRYIAGSLVTVAWRSEDRGMRDVRLQRSEDGGKTWLDFTAVPHEGASVAFPRKDGVHQFRLTGYDTLGREAHSSASGVTLLPPEGQLRIATDLIVEAGGAATVLIEPAHVLARALNPALEIFDGKRWNKVADVTGPLMTFTAPGTPGDHRLRLAFSNGDGRAFTSDEARFRVVTPLSSGRGIRLLNFLGEGIYRGGSGQLIMLRSASRLEKVEVAYSKEGGAEGTWIPVSEKRLRPMSGGLLWSPLPRLTGSRFRLRVTGRDADGRIHEDQSRRDFAIDSTAPGARVTGPERAAPGQVALEIETTPSLSPIEELSIWGTANGGKTWTLLATQPATSPPVLRFDRAGTYGLTAVAKSRVGLSGDDPVSGTLPQFVMEITGVGEPLVKKEQVGAFTRAIPKTLRGGAILTVEWQARYKGTLTLELVTGDGSEIVAQDLPANHRYSWKIPTREIPYCRLRLKAGDDHIQSTPFAIDIKPPVIESSGIED